jgi:two-component sensor histidine kinase
VPVLFVPADLAVHLGLIINELVCNSLKYAFNPEKHQPEIGILLEKDTAMQCNAIFRYGITGPALLTIIRKTLWG